jgi:hypothetical protein
MSALDDALDILTNYTGMFLPEKFPLVHAAKNELAGLRDSHKILEGELAYQEEKVLPKLRAIKDAASALIEKMNRVYANREYQTAWTMYGVHMGDYKKNGGMQWTEEQDNLTVLLATAPETSPVEDDDSN